LATFFIFSTIKDIVILEENDSKHAIKVLRLKINDSVDIINGQGVIAKGIITDANPKKTQIKILNIKKYELQNRLGLAFCPTKSNDRNDWIIEKATEIGVTDFYPIYSQNSERRKWNQERMKKITISALKQSGNLWIPKIHQLNSLNLFLDQKLNYSIKLMAHCKDQPKDELSVVAKKNKSQIIIIGPEGDFTSEEILKARDAHFKMVSIGENRLRTETACISAISFLKLV
jgi:16S rRNA (uracil1498-N3)-methyltransferase